MAAPTKAHGIKKTLANGEPSTHGACQKWPAAWGMSEFGRKPKVAQPATDFGF